MDHLKKYISEINDFPKKGIIFKDLNPVYKEPKIWHEIMLPLQKQISVLNPDYLVGIESRGFISASALAFNNGIGFISIRKANKLPGKVIGINYQLEYGEDTLEIQDDIIKKDSKFLLIDDLIATGGTASAAGQLIRKAGGDLVGYGFLVEITKLKGRRFLESNLSVESALKY
tara:strand:- start:405 stop:923 length:519 start_codon:yes stop_codon:yes gene_type:complete